jgi:hypothetical protein
MSNLAETIHSYKHRYSGGQFRPKATEKERLLTRGVVRIFDFRFLISDWGSHESREAMRHGFHRWTNWIVTQFRSPPRFEPSGFAAGFESKDLSLFFLKGSGHPDQGLHRGNARI